MGSQISDHRWFPYTGSSFTLTCYFFYRSVENSGNYSSGSGILCPNLVVIYPTGRNEGVILDSVLEAIIRYFMDNADLSKWNPKSGSYEALLRAALQTWVPGQATTASIGVYVNGQFGSVFVA